MATTETRAIALHLFRALLRAASYLPDKLARTHIHGHVVRRFKSAAEITPQRLRDARQAVGILQRACDGDAKPLRAVLNLTYARKGRGKRESINRLRAMEPHNENGPLQQLIKSQISNHPVETSRPAIKHSIPQLPEFNIWGRPIALKRRANIEKHFRSELLNKLLPPLPERHWNRLRDLSTGAITETVPRKRARGAGDPDISSCFEHPVRHVKRENFANKHRLTPRFMRRMWASVWNSSALMEPPADGNNRWRITWGGARNELSKSRLSEANGNDLELFDGADGGNIPPKSTRR